jgi:2-polyprenyl-6-methoxyphenol hydroxylase-like FAD-dependent oxidoreductase
MKVIIIGAGISGLTLAAALAQLAPRIAVEIFERDAEPAERRKGYAIGLKGDAGLAVLSRLGLREEVLTDAQKVTNFVITDRRGRTLLDCRRGATARARPTAYSVIICSRRWQPAVTTTPVQYGFQALGYEAMDTCYRAVFTGRPSRGRGCGDRR